MNIWGMLYLVSMVMVWVIGFIVLRDDMKHAHKKGEDYVLKGEEVMLFLILSIIPILNTVIFIGIPIALFCESGFTFKAPQPSKSVEQLMEEVVTEATKKIEKEEKKEETDMSCT